MSTKDLISKLSLSTFNPKQIFAQPDTVREFVLGSIIGIATGIKDGMMQDGVTPYQGLKGTFEAVLHDGKTIGSGVCYLPDAFMNPILDQLSDEVDENGEVVRAAAKSIRFAFIVKVIRAENAAGYTWGVTPMGVPVENDPLSELRTAVTSDEAKALIAGPAAETIEGTGKAPKLTSPAVETGKK